MTFRRMSLLFAVYIIYLIRNIGLEYNTKYEEWSSDTDFMRRVVEILNDYDNNERFMTWLTTVTSHQPYGKS